MKNGISAEIGKLLKEGKTVKEVIGMGYKPRTVYQVKSRLEKQPATPIPKAVKSRPKSITARSFPPTDDSLKNDPEIVRLKKEVRKAELSRDLKQIASPTEIDELVDLAIELGSDLKKTCQHYDSRQDACLGLRWPDQGAIPKGAGKPLHVVEDDSWCVRPSPLFCVLCPLADGNQRVWPMESK